jgi:hypothetical protein
MQLAATRNASRNSANLFTKRVLVPAATDGINNFNETETALDEFVLQHVGQKEDEVVDPDLALKNICTDFVVNEFFSDAVHLARFLELIQHSFTEMIDNVLTEHISATQSMSHSRSNHTNHIGDFDNTKNHSLNKGYDQPIFLFKGGNVLRMVERDAAEALPGNAADVLHQYYDPYFHRSDADFSIYVDQRDPELRDRLFVESFFLLRQLRNEQFLPHKEFYFDFFVLSDQAKEEKLAALLEQVQATSVWQDPENAKYYGWQPIGVSLWGEHYGDIPAKAVNDGSDSRQPDVLLLQPPMHSPPSSKYFVLAPDNNNTNSNSTNKFNRTTTTFQSARSRHGSTNNNNNNNNTIGFYDSLEHSPIRVSYNETLEFHSGSGKLVSFYLARTKINFAFHLRRGSVTKTVFIGGELIDVSLPKLTRDFFRNLPENVAEYSLTEPEDTILPSLTGNEPMSASLLQQHQPESEYDDTVSPATNMPTILFHSYTLRMLQEDLEKILFVLPLHPWDDLKYSKRITRLFFLYLVESLKQSSTTQDVQSLIAMYQELEEILAAYSPSTQQKSINPNVIKRLRRFAAQYSSEPISRLALQIVRLMSEAQQHPATRAPLDEFIGTVSEQGTYAIEVLQAILRQRILVPEYRLYRGSVRDSLI